ncbi:multidrug resistance protein [Micromonospora pisi]|uniref:Multidrug resistance protein n=1 Tax=Micromonospora pisi TaxID=589240 RepID=A0A495JNB1_9ACTN|nr:MFS transporter [Micromonospora pisi]RKR89519.1 multidrug resistance protein [Micromonospora pisi]
MLNSVPQPSTPVRLASASGRGLLFAAVLASGMVFLDTTVVNVALPHIGRGLDANVSGLQWTVDGYLLTLAAFVLLGGALGDRYGRRRIFLIGVVWFTSASVLCGVAQNIEWLIAARFLQGVGGALLTPGSLALIQASFHPDDRGRAIGAWSGFSGVSTALGPLLGGWLIDALSWRWIFLINVPLAVVVVFAALHWAPESRATGATDQAGAGTGGAGIGGTAVAGAGNIGTRFDITGALLGALGLAGITFALIEAAQRSGTASILAPVAGAVGVVAAIAFVLLERRKGNAAMLPPKLFRSRLFSVLNIYTVVVYASLGGFSFFLSVHLQNVAGFSALKTGLANLPMTGLLLLGSPRAGALAARIGPRLPLAVGPVIAAGGVLLLRGIGPHASFWADVVPGVFLFGLGLTLVVAPLTTSVLAAVEDQFAGVASGFNNAASRAGGVLAVAALPLLVGLSGAAYRMPAELAQAFRSAMLWCAGLLIVGALLAAFFIHRPERAPQGAQR